MTSCPKLYLDVTSACQSPLNTGVKRMQRALHTFLSHVPGYEPVYWQSANKGYRRLGPVDEVILQGRTPVGVHGLGLYDMPFSGAWSDWMARSSDGSRMLQLSMEGPGGHKNDLLFVPDLLWDNRSGYFRREVLGGIFKLAVFHDAIGLRRGWRAGVDSYFCAQGIRALAEFDLILCISREAENDLHHYWKKYGMRAAPTEVVPWPVPFTGERPHIQAASGPVGVLYVARLEEHKNHLTLLHACEMLWKQGLVFRLHLIGCNAYPWYSWRVRRMIRRLQSAGRDIEWQGHVPEDELHQAYRTARFTVFPSLLEGFGLPILESLWHGRPVVCGTGGALGEVAAGGGCEPVDPRSEASLAEGIRRLLQDRDRLEARSAEAEQREFLRWQTYWDGVSRLVRERRGEGIA